mmetsp:Transcript_20145/g.41776  ORF Transcript_20145/g.41776 Transcript_20145/m.41776 type:complete len:238 (+) Transcript_20145:76-789(+)
MLWIGFCAVGVFSAARGLSSGGTPHDGERDARHGTSHCCTRSFSSHDRFAEAAALVALAEAPVYHRKRLPYTTARAVPIGIFARRLPQTPPRSRTPQTRFAARAADQNTRSPLALTTCAGVGVSALLAAKPSAPLVLRFGDGARTAWPARVTWEVMAKVTPAPTSTVPALTIPKAAAISGSLREGVAVPTTEERSERANKTVDRTATPPRTDALSCFVWFPPVEASFHLARTQPPAA